MEITTRSFSWSHAYQRILRERAPAGIFERLHTEPRPCVLVTGCQRSGTTWMRKILAEALPSAVAPKELDSCAFLIEGRQLDSAAGDTLVLQVTFANVYPASFVRLPATIPVVLMVRNPHSVCRSMVYNWDALAVEYAHRKGGPCEAPSLAGEQARWQAAIEMYCESARAAIDVVRQRPECTRLVIYDDLVENGVRELRELADFLGRPLTIGTAASRVDGSAPAKQTTLPAAFRRWIARECLPPYGELVALARERSGRYVKSAGPTDRP